jgi:hypothetical protein
MRHVFARSGASSLTAIVEGSAIVRSLYAALITLLCLLRPLGVAAEDLAKFGYGRLSTLGSRPTLVVYANYAGLPPITSIPQLQAVVFGPDTPSINGYFAEMSGNRFQLDPSPGFFVLPLSIADGRGPYPLLDMIARVFPQLSLYDRNGDGRVTPDELIILVFSNLPDAATKAHADCAPTPMSWLFRQVELCSTLSLVTFDMDIGTIAHELVHAISGANDLYGANVGGLNCGVTLRCGT